MSKTVVITGATGGLGKRTAQAFAKLGHSLVLLDHNPDRLQELARSLDLTGDRLLVRAMDLRDAEAIRAAAEETALRFGGADALIHLIGGWVGGKSLVEASGSDLEFMLAQHVWTTFHLFQAYAPQLAGRGWGRVLIVSPSTVPNPPGKSGPYTAAKAAQETLLLNLAAELKDQGVTANIIQVRAIDEEGSGKGTSPDEIVAAMLYLFSQEASRISGARIPLY